MLMLSRRVFSSGLVLLSASLCGIAPAEGQVSHWMSGTPAPASGRVVARYEPTSAYSSSAPADPYHAYYAGGQPGLQTPVSSHAQNTVTYRVSAPSPYYQPTVVYQNPQDICNPAPVAYVAPRRSCWDLLTSCFGGGSSGQPAVAMDPGAQAAYRTTWKQIPVTRYRPVISADPATGCPVTVMRPCTTYAWQPERERCGFFRRLFGQCDPPAIAVTPCCPDPCMTTPCVVTSDSCGCGVPGAAPSMVPTPAAPPYYAPGGIPSAGSGVPSSVLPSAPTLSPQAVPSLEGGSPGTGMPPSAGPEPADVRPSLVPGQGDFNSALGGPQPLSALPQNPAGAANGPVLAGESVDSESDSRTRTILNRTVPLPTFGIPGAEPSQPRPTPVPDPDAIPTQTEEDPNAPQLLNPRDQVAVLRSDQAWAVTPIRWPQTSRAGSAAGSRTTAEPPRRRAELDESGWKSIAR